MPSSSKDVPVDFEVATRLRSAGFEVGADRAALLTAFLEQLWRWNQVYNLTGIHDAEQMVERHLIESLALGPLLRGTRIADVGTGAGLPGIPLAVTEQEREFTLIESRAKRVHFLRHVTGELRLANVAIEHCRAEDLPADRPFDTVLGRAVAAPAELLRICRPLTAPGSVLLLLTASHLEDELRAVATDFSVRNVNAAIGGRIRGSIVVLERAHA